MSITFDQVDGVVQKAADTTAPADAGGAAASPTAGAQRPVAEQAEETQRRMEWMNRRLHAD